MYLVACDAGLVVEVELDVELVVDEGAVDLKVCLRDIIKDNTVNTLNISIDFIVIDG